MSAALTFSGKPVTRKQVRATLLLLKYFRAFLVSTSTHCLIPGDWTRRELTKEQARRHLFLLIDTAINRKAGQPDETPKQEQRRNEWRRDQQRLQDIARRIRVYQFGTDEVRERFSHLLSRYDD